MWLHHQYPCWFIEIYLYSGVHYDIYSTLLSVLNPDPLSSLEGFGFDSVTIDRSIQCPGFQDPGWNVLPVLVGSSAELAWDLNEGADA